MTKDELRRLIKLEQRIMEIAEELGLKTMPIEFDIVPDQKMLEIMAYRSPTNISNWKFGRDYERLRTMHENTAHSLPYEVVINSNPSRAYFMKSNVFVVQVLVMAHVVGHVNFFTENRHFQESRRDIIEYMAEAGRRFRKYERRYGIDEVESIIDAGHAIQLHSNPFEKETEEEKRERVFKQKRQQFHAPKTSEFADLTSDNSDKVKEDIELFNQKLWRTLRLKTPVEPTEDLMRYVIDNSPVLENWQKDILEVLRNEGQYYWPMMKTKYMNEGWATYWHQIIMDRLFEEKLLDTGEHAQYNFSNSLVKAENPMSLNPYLVGFSMWKDIEERWNKGRHGSEWENCNDWETKENWDDKSMKGRERMFNAMRNYTDWFFMQDFLTPELVNDLNIYIYVEKENPATIDYVRIKDEARKARDMIIASFAHSGIPKIEITNGNYEGKGELKMVHNFGGSELDKKFSEETLKHIFRLWGKACHLQTKVGGRNVTYIASLKGGYGNKGATGDPRGMQSKRQILDITSLQCI